MDNKPKKPVSAKERADIARAILTWINTCPYFPTGMMEYEYLDSCGFALSKEPITFKSKQFIDGSYQAQFVFHIVYRNSPLTVDDRLKMDETLTHIAEWCETSLPLLEKPMKALRVSCIEDAAICARYDNGTEDHQIQMKMIYEVKK